MLKIIDLHATVSDHSVLNGVNLEISKGEIHVIMGPNGAGKSSLSQIIAGHPSFKVTAGKIIFDGYDILSLKPEDRSRLGIFMSFQNPLEIPGLSNFQFLYSMFNAHSSEPISEEDFDVLLKEKLAIVKMKNDFVHRNLNEGFSGGERKRHEILQMALLNPKLAILDEIDSGLDVDSTNIVAHGINSIIDKNKSLLIITHHQRILNHIIPNQVHVLCNGKIIQSGDASLAKKIEEEGFFNG